MRAISPSSRMISQMTAAGSRPASRARSTEPSVCPERTSTPPAPRASGNTWPGRDEVVGPGVARYRDPDGLGPLARRDPGRDPVTGVDADRERRVARRTVVRRHHGSPSVGHPLLGQRQADEAAPVARHEVDRPPGVTRSAAMTRSPSFSRSSSSTRMTIRPARMASRARTTAAWRSSADKTVPPHHLNRHLRAGSLT